MRTIKIEIRKQTTLGGNTYYNLYVNDQYQTLFSKQEEAELKAKEIEDLFLAGAMDPKVIYSRELSL